MRQLSVLAACLCLCSVGFSQESPTTSPVNSANESTPTAAASKKAAPRPVMEGLVSSLALLKDYQAARVSSEARDSNHDWLTIGANETTTIAFLKGPGEITHLWTTIATPDKNHLRNIVLRIYWDGSDFPSVEAPIGDFYGLGMNRYYYFNNPVQAIGTENGMNAFWPMPFAKSARVEITNESTQPVNSFYYYVDWRKLAKLPKDAAYFHAQYHQAFPNEDGKPYLILETGGGRGHFVGVSLSIHTNVGGWWGEGDDIFTIDGEKRPSLWGTGSEDYFCGAWCYGKTFYTDYFGMPLREKMDHSADNLWNVYRLHLENPIPFKKSLKMEIEHGAQGFDETRAGRNNNYSSVAYWYMDRPTRLQGTLPPAKDRISHFEAPAGIPGVFEPQYMAYQTPEGVRVEAQGMGHFEKDAKWFHGDQLLVDAGEKIGSTLNMEFKTTQTIEGPVVLRFTKAPDYGKVAVAIDGEVLIPELNLYADEVMPMNVDAGRLYLSRGKHTLTVKSLGKDERSSGVIWGLDYLRIGSEQPEVEKGEPAMQIARPAQQAGAQVMTVANQAAAEPASAAITADGKAVTPIKAGQVIEIRSAGTNGLELRVVSDKAKPAKKGRKHARRAAAQ